MAHKQRSIYLSTQLKNKLMSVVDEECSFNSAVQLAIKEFYKNHVDEVIREQKRLEAADIEMQKRIKYNSEKRERDLQMLRNYKEN